ncbi:MAG: ribosome biogenesis GTPase Der, partial [Verrucomicrobiia bacterium]
FRAYYAVHTAKRPFRIKIFCNQSKKLNDSYKRYLQSKVVEAFKLEGCPVVFDLVNKKNPYVREE